MVEIFNVINRWGGQHRTYVCKESKSQDTRSMFQTCEISQWGQHINDLNLSKWTHFSIQRVTVLGQVGSQSQLRPILQPSSGRMKMLWEGFGISNNVQDISKKFRNNQRKFKIYRTLEKKRFKIFQKESKHSKNHVKGYKNICIDDV